MARTAKKEKVLTPEEKLVQALVPNMEQPYRVPENWCWTTMERVAQWGSGGTPSRGNPSLFGGNIPWVKTGELNDDYIFYTEETLSEDGLMHSSAKIFPINTIIIAMYGATVGKVGILGIEAATNQACACGKCSSAVDYKYLYFYARSQKDIFIDKARGGAQPNISQEMIKSHPIPIPPLTEQQRIVDRIESLFAKLDEAKEKAQIVVDGFEDRKAAILHKAFTGELTEEWRSTHGVSIDEWENAPLETVFQLRSGSTINASEEQEYGAIPYVKVADMNLPENEIQITTSSRFVDNCPESHVIPKGSTIFPKRGGAILTNKKRYVGVEKIIADLNTMAIMPIAGRAYGWYGYYWMQSVDLRQLNNGSNVPQINNKDMVKLFVPTPSTDEQKVIVGILDSIFEKEIETKELAEQVIDQIDAMKKSILARAFRGELGTNDPNDESAVDLLKRVL